MLFKKKFYVFLINCFLRKVNIQIVKLKVDVKINSTTINDAKGISKRRKVYGRKNT